MIERVVTEVERALEELDETFEESGPFTEALWEAHQIPLQERQAALARTRLVAAVTPLLEWLGAGRGSSPSGGIRRADIEQVAAMLDISAIGVSKRPPLTPGDQEADLADLGLLTVDEEHEFQVPPALLPTVVHGIADVLDGHEDFNA